MTALFSACATAALFCVVVAWHYGKRLHRRWLAIHPWHSTRSYGHIVHHHVRVIGPAPYDWDKELHG